jgi:hypothetical protein
MAILIYDRTATSSMVKCTASGERSTGRSSTRVLTSFLYAGPVKGTLLVSDAFWFWWVNSFGLTAYSWVPFKSLRTNANRIVPYDSALSIPSTSPWAGISTNLTDTSQLKATLRVGNALRPAFVGRVGGAAWKVEGTGTRDFIGGSGSDGTLSIDCTGSWAWVLDLGDFRLATGHEWISDVTADAYQGTNS